MGWFCPRCGQDAGAEGTCPHDGERLAPVSRHDLIGRSLGEYKVLASLGGGSFGSVYRAVHSRSGMLAAIKLLHRPIDDVESQRVIVESRAAAMLSHPNVVQVYDLAATSDRRPYIVMQLLDGTPLADLLSLRMPVGQALSIVGDVLAGLGHAHRRGVVHRDLKPDNIFIAKGRAVIVDFGLAKLISDPRAPSLTATGEALGTPSYMAPEQVRGELADGRADLYAVGCVLFEMLAGHPPFQGSATYAIFDAHLNQPAPSITEHRNDVPPHVVGAIARVLAKDPDARFASAHEMQRALAGTPAPKRRRWPIVAGIAAATAITVTIAIAAVAGSAVGTRRRARRASGHRAAAVARRATSRRQPRERARHGGRTISPRAPIAVRMSSRCGVGSPAATRSRPASCVRIPAAWSRCSTSTTPTSTPPSNVEGRAPNAVSRPPNRSPTSCPATSSSKIRSPRCTSNSNPATWCGRRSQAALRARSLRSR